MSKEADRMNRGDTVGLQERIQEILAMMVVPEVLLALTGCIDSQGASSVIKNQSASYAECPSEEYAREYGYPTNAPGLTYGPPVRTDEDRPDLIPAEGDDGIAGCVYVDDSFGEPPSTIEEALASSPNELFDIPVYKSDGIAEIGTFAVNGGIS